MQELGIPSQLEPETFHGDLGQHFKIKYIQNSVFKDLMLMFYQVFKTAFTGES